ncbi:serine/threonine-protein kinase [Cryptosporangium phraense]|uniref:non-specific serine/threonine protein kinase n=1 Tax=Cryptosporangium phraense TaxID=2593070 RepID=A0A545AYA2_9ACTN|nr:serine/threonine-protein kinase [Cryptosporangium phraense]TQS46296.1 protein kinase [Cryptosporangium phraense]
MSGDSIESARLEGLRAAGYEMQSLIGRGGMAYVYRAEDTRLGRIVAVKVLAPELAQNEEFRQRFLRESRLAASLDHPNIIPIYEAGEVDGHLYLAMRFVEGADLKVVLKRRGTLTVDEAMGVFGQVGAALDAAHKAGLVHRDVKPANILVSAATAPGGRDHVYLSDFGLTKRASSLTGVTATGIVVGTMDYVAPEQIGGKAVDARTDVYALGCVVYQSLTGKVPFTRDDDAALLWAHLMEMPAPISSVRPDIPAAVDKVVETAMAKGPEGRFASCGEFISALGAAFSGNPVNLPASATGGTAVSPSSAPPSTYPGSPTYPGGPQSGAQTGAQTGAQPQGTTPLPTTHIPGGEYSPQTPYPHQYSPTQFPPGTYPPQSAPPHSAPPASAPPQYSTPPPGMAPYSAPPSQHSGVPYPYSAPPQPGSAPPYPYSAPPAASAPPYPYSSPPHGVSGPPHGVSGPPHGVSGPPAGSASSSGSGRRKLLIGGLAAAIVVVIVLVGISLLKPFQEGTKHFTANETVPISFDYPASWKQAGPGTNVVFSPHASEALSLFGTPGASTVWSDLDRVEKKDPDSVVGVYTTLSTTDFPANPDDRKASLSTQLPATVTLNVQQTTVVDGRDATRHDGSLQESGGDGNLRIRCFIVKDPTSTQTVVLVFFASESAWDKNEGKFKTLLDSVKFRS